MFNYTISPFGILAGASIFFLVGSIWLLLVVAWRSREASRDAKLSNRLSGLAPVEDEGDGRVLKLWHDGKVNAIKVHGHVSRFNVISIVDDMRKAFGWTMPLPTFMMGLFGIEALAFAITLAISQDVYVALAVALGLLLLMKSQAARRVTAQEAVFERQLSEALGLATRSLRAGHPLLSAFQLIVDEGEAPVKHVFAEIVQQQALGKSLEEAIISTAERSQSSDMKLFAASTVIQLRSGGNVADMMDRLSDVIRDRIRLHRKVRVLTSQTQLSKKILMALPFLLFAYLYISKREYIEPLFTTEAGKVMMLAAVVLLFIGNWTMNRIATLSY